MYPFLLQKLCKDVLRGGDFVSVDKKILKWLEKKEKEFDGVVLVKQGLFYVSIDKSAEILNKECGVPFIEVLGHKQSVIWDRDICNIFYALSLVLTLIYITYYMI